MEVEVGGMADRCPLRADGAPIHPRHVHPPSLVRQRFAESPCKRRACANPLPAGENPTFAASFHDVPVAPTAVAEGSRRRKVPAIMQFLSSHVRRLCPVRQARRA
jgi:hypothetical protein